MKRSDNVKNKFLTYKQFIALVLITVVTTNFIIFPFISGSILSVTGGLLLALIYILMYGRINLDNTFIKFVFSIKFILTSGILLGIFSEISRDIFLRNTNIFIILSVVFAATVYCSYNDKVVGSVGRLLYIFILLPVISVILFSLNDIKFNNLIYSFNRFSILDIFTLSIVSMIYESILFLGNFTDKDLTHKNIFRPVIFSVCILFLTNLCITGRFGISVYNYKYPSFELMYSSDLPGYIVQRQEGILISFFLMGLLVVISLFMLLSLKIKTINNKKYINYILIYIAATISVFYKNIMDLYIVVNFFCGLAVILLSLLLRGVKHEK